VDIILETNIKKVAKSIENIGGRQARYAARLAVNDVAFESKAAFKKHTQQVFDRPTPSTQNAAFIDRAPVWREQSYIDASVYIKDFLPKGVPPQKYLYAEQHGGFRRDKRSEIALKNTYINTKKHGAKPILPKNMQTAIHPDYQNKYGNITSGLITRILSDLRANPDPMQNRTNKAARFFVIHPEFNRKGMMPGIYERRGGSLKIIIMFIRKPYYRKRMRFNTVVKDTVKKNFAARFKSRYREALMTARPTRFVI
jgi:hypothetical protein